MILKLKIIGIPFAKQSAKFYRKGNFVKSYQPKEIKEKEANVRTQVITQLPEDFKIIEGAVRINKALFVFPILKSFSKYKINFIKNGGIFYKTTKPDLDSNLFKGMIDALNGVIFKDDSQIVEICNSRKIFGVQPKIELELEEIGECEIEREDKLIKEMV